MSSGNLLLKIVARESHLDADAETSSIWTKLALLDACVMTIGCDVAKFNGHVKSLTDQLARASQPMTLWSSPSRDVVQSLT
jgi:hypothetical protein